MYTVIAYKKNGTAYAKYGEYEKLGHARAKVEELEPYLARGELRTEYGEHLNCIEVYNGDELICGSYK